MTLRGLFDLDVRVAYHLAPDLDLAPDSLAEGLGRTARGRDAVVLQLARGVLKLENSRHLGVNALDDRRRHAFWADQPVPQRRLVARHARFRDRRHLRLGGD